MTKLADTPELQPIVAAPGHSLPLTWRLASLRLMMLAVADAGSVGEQAHAPWTGSEQDGGERVDCCARGWGQRLRSTVHTSHVMCQRGTRMINKNSICRRVRRLQANLGVVLLQGITFVS